MNVFEAIKRNVTARQAAEAYGLKVGRTGMACCPFHSDKSPSMKLDERYYCFSCGVTGDAVDLTAKLFGIGLKDAAIKLADDFGIRYDSRQKPSIRPKIWEPTPEQKTGRKKTTAFRCCLIIFIFSVIGKNGTHRNSRRTNGIHCLWKLCKEKAISNICWIFFCWANRKKRKLLYRSNEKR